MFSFFGFNTFCCHFPVQDLSLHLFMPFSPSHSLFIVTWLLHNKIWQKSAKISEMNFIWWKMQSQTNDKRIGLLPFLLLLDNRKILKKMSKKIWGWLLFFIWHIIYTAQTWMNELQVSDKSFQFICTQKMWLS